MVVKKTTAHKKTMKAESNNAPKNLIPINRFSLINLAIFVLVFVGISSYFLFSSRATSLSGDINGDGTVNITDLSLLLSSFGSRVPTCTTNPSYTCDINGDNVVNIVDLSILLSHFGQSVGTLSQACTAGAPSNIHEYVDGCPLFNSGSWVNTQLPANAPVDPNSASMATKLLSQVGVDSTGTITGASGLRWFNTYDLYVTQNADRNTFKTVCSREVLNNTSWAWMTDLHNAWMTLKVPVPASIPNYDGGSDHGSEIYDAATNEMWDFYVGPDAAPAGTTDPQGRTCDYIATGGDYQQDVAHSPGYFITQSLGSGLQEDKYWGRSAAALPEIAGDITPDEWNNPLQGFNHTLNMVVPWADPNLQYWPAERHDGGSGGAGGLPEGARVRIDPTYTCPHGTSTGGANQPTQLAYDRAYELCVTLQKYGAVVYDQTGNGAAFGFTYPTGGKPFSRTPDGGFCCSGQAGGTQWPNWYWDTGVSQLLPHLQVIDQSYRPPYAPSQN